MICRPILEMDKAIVVSYIETAVFAIMISEHFDTFFSKLAKG